MKYLALSLTMVMVAISAQAQTYAEIGYTSASYEETVLGYNAKASPSALRGFFGYEINPNLSLEGMIANGLSDANVSGLGNVSGLSLKIDNVYGIYAKPKFQFTPSLEGFLRIGYAHINGSVTYQGISTSSSGSSLSGGLGLSYAVDSKLSLNIDTMSYYNKDSTTASGVTIGLGYKF